MEDTSWLSKESDHLHINVAKLEAVGHGVNMAIAWSFMTFMLAVDSPTVVSWMTSVIDKRNCVHMKGVAEMPVKCHLGVIGDMITEHGLEVTIRFVPSMEKKAFRMTRVPKKWLEYREAGEGAVNVVAAIVTGESSKDAIWAAHLPHDLGIDRTLFLA